MMMSRLLLLSAALVAFSCEASFPEIAGYSPQSLVTDQNAIDLDQKFIEDTLGAKNLLAAKAFFEKGAHSGSYAVILVDPPGIPAAPPAGTEVVAQGENGVETRGYLREGYDVGDTELAIVYHVSDNQDSWVSCRVGALVAIEGAYKDGCFAETGNMTFVDSNGSRQQSFNYSYNLRRDNLNFRTIFGFSSQAERRMKDCGPACPYETFSKFYEYYGIANYSNVWIEAAFGRTTTDFPGKGNQDFSLLDEAGIAEVIKKGTAYLSVWMHVTQQMEEAVNICQDGCVDCNPQPLRSWDQAVAFYTGSLEGVDGSGTGVLLHALADKRCADFKTCGRNGGELEGISKVNHDIFNLFAKGSDALEKGQCADAKSAKRSIERLMAVPLIQGTLRYAHKRSLSDVEDDKELAEGAVFAAAVLPLLNNCSEPIADYVFESMKVGSTTPTDFIGIKGGFEQVYNCMEINGADVGGLWDTSSGRYYDGAEPLGARGNGGNNAGLAVGLTIGILAVLVIGTVLFRRYRRSSPSTAAPPTSMPPAVTIEGLT